MSDLTIRAHGHNSLVFNSFAVLDGVQENFERHVETSQDREDQLMTLFAKMQEQYIASEARHAEEKNLLEERVTLLSKQLELNNAKLQQFEAENEAREKKNGEVDKEIASTFYYWSLHEQNAVQLCKTLPKDIEALKETFKQIPNRVAGINSAVLSNQESVLALAEAHQKIAAFEKQLAEIAIASQTTRKIASTAATAAGVSTDILTTYTEAESASLLSLHGLSKELEEARQKIALLENEVEERTNLAYDRILVKKSPPEDHRPLHTKNTMAIHDREKDQKNFYLYLVVKNGKVTVHHGRVPSGRKIGDRIETDVIVHMHSPTPLTKEEVDWKL